MTQTVLILGATSEIGGEIAARLAPGRRVVLAARRVEALAEVEAAVIAAGAVNVEKLHFEATDHSAHRGIIESVGEISHAVVCFGILGDQKRAEHDEHHAVEIATVDYASQVSALTVLSDVLRKQSSPATIIAFSSIAGWRARRANFVYGSTKAGLDAFCQGLIDALHGSNVSLILARPGFVIGKMTEGMKPAPMSVTADVVAEAVVDAAQRGKSATLWIPSRLRVLAWIMSVVPRPIWRRMPR